jgi:hypothetical protein
MSRLYIRVLVLLVVLVSINGCGSGSDQPQSDSQAIYMLMDTSGTYTKELEQAQRVINYTLSELKPGDSFSLARIDTGSFSEKDIITKATFDGRPSVSNEQKRAFQEKVSNFMKHVKGSSYTDITGGILQAIEYLNETGAGHKTILIFSDLKEDLQAGYVRKGIPLPLNGFKVVALNVTKLRSDNVDPRKYLARVKSWKQRVESNGGKWEMINDLQRLESILSI